MNILLTSAGRRSYLVKYFREALNGDGKIFVANSSETVATQDADGFFISPLIYDEGYVDSIINYCLANRIKAIISLFDIDLLVLAKAKEKIESRGIRLLLAREDVVELCNDKWKTFEFLKKNGIGAPLTFKSLNDVKNALSNKIIKFPIIIKPRWGMASLGIYVADNMQELAVLTEKSVKEIQRSYLRYESSSTPLNMVLFQEKLEGQEYGLDVIVDLDGKFVGCFPKSKLQMRAGETDVGQTVSSKPFNLIAKELARLLKLEVILSVDCFVHEASIKVLEMNCRISGHYPLSHLAGVNLPLQIVQWLEGKGTDPRNFRFTEGLYITKDLTPRIINGV